MCPVYLGPSFGGFFLGISQLNQTVSHLEALAMVRCVPFFWGPSFGVFFLGIGIGRRNDMMSAAKAFYNKGSDPCFLLNFYGVLVPPFLKNFESAPLSFCTVVGVVLLGFVKKMMW